MTSRFLTAILGLTIGLGAVPAQAEDSRTYFTSRINEREVAQQLSRRDREYYRELFNAIDAERWGKVEELLDDRSDGLLHDVAMAEYYTAATSPTVSLEKIERWLRTGRDLPHAAQLGRLAVRRGAEVEPELPYVRDLNSQRGIPRRIRPRAGDDGTLPASTRAAILDRITNDDPEGAHDLLNSVDAQLSSSMRAEWRQRVAWSFFIENKTAQSLELSRTVSQGSGPWVAEGDWSAGVAAWRLNDCETAGAYFGRAAGAATNPTLQAASLYWAARSALVCRQPDLSTRLLSQAANLDETLYGMLASEQLGQALPDRVENADFNEEDWQSLRNIKNVQVAIALDELGREILASEILNHQSRIGSPTQYAALSRLARTLGFPRTQLHMAYNAPAGGLADPASFFPAPKIAPLDGWQVDPGLAFAHILQESNFRARVVSPARAQGLMQITPITVRQHAGCVGRSAGSLDVFDPATNLSLGQCNLLMLNRNSATQGKLPKIMAAYNAGLTPIGRWETEIDDQDDPLLYMEAIPYWETRGYVSIVMRNYWMYERQAGAQSATRLSLAQNDWPLFPTGQSNSGRVYLSTGNE